MAKGPQGSRRVKFLKGARPKSAAVKRETGERGTDKGRERGGGLKGTSRGGAEQGAHPAHGARCCPCALAAPPPSCF